MTLTHSLNTIKNSSKALYDDVSGHVCSTSSHVGNHNFFIINSWIFIYTLWLLLRIKLKCGLVCELTLRVNRHSNGQESALSHHYVF